MDLCPLDRAVLELLGPCPTLLRLRSVVHALRERANELEFQAEARVWDTLSVRSVPQETHGQRDCPCPDGRFIRVTIRNIRTGAAFISLGHKLWDELGQPQRLDLKRRGDRIVLARVERGGYAVTRANDGLPHLVCGAESLRLLRVDCGKSYQCWVEDEAVVIGAVLD
jgi:hypothetical protein